MCFFHSQQYEDIIWLFMKLEKAFCFKGFVENILVFLHRETFEPIHQTLFILHQRFGEFLFIFIKNHILKLLFFILGFAWKAII